MFRRLKREKKPSDTSNTQSPSVSPSASARSRSFRKRESEKTYSEILRKKKNESEYFDYEIVTILDQVYQGEFYKN